jgi:hypothetical protein
VSAWLIPIADREALRWVVTQQRSAFPAYRAPDAARLAEGDTVLIYTTRGCFNNPRLDRGRVAGSATVTRSATVLTSPVRFGDREFTIGVRLSIDRLAAPRRGVVLADVVDRLGASFPIARGWGAYLRRAIVPLVDDDAATLSKMLGAISRPYTELRKTYSAL